MAFIHKIPLHARPTYYWDLRHMILDGLFNGAAYHLLKYVARKTVEVSEFQLALIYFFLHLGMFFSFLLPHLFRVKNKKSFIFFTAVPAKLLFVALAFISDPFGFCAVSCMALFLLRMYLPMHASILKCNYPDSHRATIYSHVKSISMGVSILSALGAGALLFYNGMFYRAIFPVAAVLGILGTLLFMNIRERRPRGVEIWTSIVPLRRIGEILYYDRIYTAYQIIFFIAGFANLMGLPIYVLYIVDTLHAQYVQIALVEGIINNIVSMLTLKWWGKFMDTNPNPMRMRALLTLLWMFHPLLHAWAWDMSLIYLASALFGVLMAGGELNWLLGPLYFCDERDAPAYTMIHSCNTGLRGVFAPLLGYTLYEAYGFQTTFYTIAALMLLATVLMYALYLATWQLPRFQEKTLPQALSISQSDFNNAGRN